jgi:hypothetical protein
MFTIKTKLPDSSICEQCPIGEIKDELAGNIKKVTGKECKDLSCEEFLQEIINGIRLMLLPEVLSKIQREQEGGKVSTELMEFRRIFIVADQYYNRQFQTKKNMKAVEDKFYRGEAVFTNSCPNESFYNLFGFATSQIGTREDFFTTLLFLILVEDNKESL